MKPFTALSAIMLTTVALTGCGARSDSAPAPTAANANGSGTGRGDHAAPADLAAAGTAASTLGRRTCRPRPGR